MAGSDLSFSMMLRLMDGWSGPADKVRQSMRNLARGSRELQQELGRKLKTGFSPEALEAAFSRSEARISNARQRLIGAAAMAVTLGAPVIQAGNFEERMIHFTNLAEIGADRAKQLEAQLDELRKSTGQSKLQVLDGLEAYVGKGMGLDEALAAMRATGRAAKATGSDMNEMANSGFAVMDNLGVAPDQLRKAFDIMAKSGKEGSFELSAMARKFPEITAGAKALEMEGVDAVASLSAALQIAMKSAGSEDQAATNFTNFLGKITSPDTRKAFSKFGVDIKEEMRIALERGADPLEHMLLVIKKMTGDDAFKLADLFVDKQARDFLNALLPDLEKYQRIKEESLGADGVIDADHARVMEGFNEQFRQLKDSVSSLLGASGALLPVFTDIMREIRFGVEAVSAWTTANPELTATIVKGTAALLAFGIATRVVGFGFAVMQGGILRAATLFLKFDKAGKNISLLGRAARGAGWSMSRLYRGGRGLARLMRTPLRWAITPLKWTARIIPAIPWRSLAKMLGWGKLIRPLVWTSRLIPAIGWGKMAGRLGVLGMTAGGWGKLIKPLVWFAKTGLRFIGPISWALFAVDLGLFTWDLVMKMLGWEEWINPGGLSEAWGGLPTLFLSDKIKAERPKITDAAGFDSLPEETRTAATVIDEQFRGGKSGGNLATTGYTDDLAKHIADLTAQIGALEQEISIIKDGPTAEVLRDPIRQRADQLREELAWATGEAAAAAERQEGLKAAIAGVTGKQVSGKLAEEDITRTLDQVRAEASRQAEAVRGAAVKNALSPITRAINEGKKSGLTLETSERPRPKPEPYAAAQPNVTVESTFASSPKVNVNVQVSMPISITREQRAENRVIAARAGREAGAATERAVRRSLDDAANVE